MWMGEYTGIQLLGLFFQALCVENFLLSNFLGMCTYLACSTSLKTANGLGVAVVFVMTISGVLNYFVHHYFTAEHGLDWLQSFGIDTSHINLNFLEFLLFISVIAAFTQIAEIIIEKVSLPLYRSLGIYLPLIAVNCAVLGVCLFSVIRNLPFLPHVVYVFGSACGWWLAIALMAAIREKIAISSIFPSFKGMGITFIITGFIAMVFMGFSGIRLF